MIVALTNSSLSSRRYEQGAGEHRQAAAEGASAGRLFDMMPPDALAQVLMRMEARCAGAGLLLGWRVRRQQGLRSYLLSACLPCWCPDLPAGDCQPALQPLRPSIISINSTRLPQCCCAATWLRWARRAARCARPAPTARSGARCCAAPFPPLPWCALTWRTTRCVGGLQAALPSASLVVHRQPVPPPDLRASTCSGFRRQALPPSAAAVCVPAEALAGITLNQY